MFKLYRTIKFHRLLWKWLALTGSRDKKSWPLWHVGQYVQKYPKQFRFALQDNACFPCAYTTIKVTMVDKSECELCPLEWPTGECDTLGGLWTLWNFHSNVHQRKALAYKIGNLPLKPYPLRKLAWWNNR